MLKLALASSVDGSAISWSFVAIAEGKLGRKEEAIKALARMAQISPELARDPFGVYKNIRLQILSPLLWWMDCEMLAGKVHPSLVTVCVKYPCTDLIPMWRLIYIIDADPSYAAGTLNSRRRDKTWPEFRIVGAGRRRAVLAEIGDTHWRLIAGEGNVLCRVIATSSANFRFGL